MGCSCSSTGVNVAKPLRHLVCQERGIGISVEAMFLLPHVVVPVKTLQPHSLRLEVAIVQQQLYLLCGFTPTCEIMLRQLLNHDGMNKLS
jgi:hypothetical protein